MKNEACFVPFMIELDCDIKTMSQRLLNRAKQENSDIRNDDHIQAINRRYKNIKCIILLTKLHVFTKKKILLHKNVTVFRW